MENIDGKPNMPILQGGAEVRAIKAVSKLDFKVIEWIIKTM